MTIINQDLEMTNKEAADILERCIKMALSPRRNGKSYTTMRVNLAFRKAIIALRASAASEETVMGKTKLMFQFGYIRKEAHKVALAQKYIQAYWEGYAAAKSERDS